MTRGRIVIDLFTTLDGVAQAPGGPDEDRSNGFAWGGWQAPLNDETVGERVGAGIRRMDALLLGRRTYDIFAAYWPQRTGGDEGFIGRRFNEIPKYVATRGALEPAWAGTTVIGPDELAATVDGLRDRHDETHVIGSVDLVQTLLRAQLFDELNLWVYPIVLGEGKKVFPEGAAPARLRLLEPAVSGAGGALLLRYGPDGVPETGDMTTEPTAG
ncbi:dihydrofolate reductase family protein [Microbacterium sp. W1N]|uniref:dihydrofolate reductase family protein n=1 Tax=Microbacterium festucae TaxID=2977531 RepID=UPI0021C21028|nr:dihydrofolate reductase family protein [Microbacterium festucae]MCT9819651.1 dihydrofolate reductase family protein [Microbacterium festucae]